MYKCICCIYINTQHRVWKGVYAVMLIPECMQSVCSTPNNITFSLYINFPRTLPYSSTDIVHKATTYYCDICGYVY